MTEERSGRDLSDAADRILAGRAADGDVRAFEVLVRRYGRLMRAYAYRILGSTSDVDDVVQEAFITAWRKLPELADLDVVKSWLMRIVSNRALDQIRRRRETADITDHDQPAPEEQSPLAQAEAMSLDHALKAALAALPDDQRRCWVLREIGETATSRSRRSSTCPRAPCVG